MKKTALLPTIVLFLLFFTAITLNGQTIGGYQTNGSRENNIYTAVPFLLITPHPRSGAMGNAGVALNADANSMVLNTAALAFLPEKNYGASISYSPWLKQLTTDMSISYLSGYYRLNNRHTISASLRYFSIGTVKFTDQNYQDLGTYKPSEMAVDVGYAINLGPSFALGGNLRYISSNLSGGGSINGLSNGTGTAVAVDISGLYQNAVTVLSTEAEWRLGFNFSNIGTKLNYKNTGASYFLPINMQIGTALKIGNGENKVTVALDLNKLMVPTQPIYDNNGNIVKGKNPDRSIPSGIFGSFSDAPGGFSEELKEIGISTGLEFAFKEKFFFRGGYSYQHPEKGNLSYITTGLGFKYNTLSFDFSYLLASSRYNPMSNTLRFGLQANFGASRL